MQSVVAYILLYISASFYCGFDAVLKEKAIEHSKSIGNSTFDLKCEIYECLGKSLKVYEDSKFLEDGWVMMVGAFSEFKAETVDYAKKEIGKCLPKVNQQISSFPKCTQFKIGMALLEDCITRALPNRSSHSNLLDMQ